MNAIRSAVLGVFAAASIAGAASAAGYGETDEPNVPIRIIRIDTQAASGIEPYLPYILGVVIASVAVSNN